MSASNPLSRAGAATVVGGGIAGATVAYELARRGTRVTLIEQRSIAHAASGRNMGLLLNQVEREVVRIMHQSLGIYREVESAGIDFALRQEVQLLLARDQAQLAAAERRARGTEALGVSVRAAGPTEIRDALPQLASDLAGGWIVDGAWALEPNAATRAFIEAARAHGAVIRAGVRAHEVVSRAGRVEGVL